MKIKTQDLTGAALDWAVSHIELNTAPTRGEYIKPWVLDAHKAGQGSGPYSTDWQWGGPIIERERINLNEDIHPTLQWMCTLYVLDEEPWQMYGPTPLIAAMRCFVASKLGDEVDIPEGLQP